MADDDTRRNADFVARVVSDPKSPPETRMLTGWLGDAADEGYRRLYTNAELSAYLDVPADAILHTESIRDVQPSGGVFIWVRRDAALKQGGSAASRAARFLQGQVEQDFASGGGPAAGGAGGSASGSLENAGYRCVTQVPCGEPTGFTGQCTKQPEVGGAWPCITAIPHCLEPTGFTGQCTHQPWPNPTRYVGCTFLHCPTHDLTHVPHICNVAATGAPGCVVVHPPQGDVDAAAKADAEGGESEARRAAAPATSIPGCGYTQTWGLCETHLLGCGHTKLCPTHLPGCGETKDCPTALPGCGWSKNPICTDLPGCGWTQHWGLCQTQTPKCAVSVDIPCITHDLACGPTRNPACLVNPGGEEFAAFRAAAPGAGFPVTALPCNVTVGAAACPSAPDLCPTVTVPPTKMETCTKLGPHCPTSATVCTQIGPQCPTSCGQHCQSQQVNCTQMGEVCLTHPVECTQFAPKCPTLQPAQCPPTQVGPACHTPTPPVCWQPADAQAFRAVGPIGPIGPTGFQGCTQSGPQCPTYPSGDCTFFGCPPATQACPTHQPPCTQCHTQQFECTMFCTQGAPGCPPLTQSAQCGPSAVDACPTRLCPPGGGGDPFAGGGGGQQLAAAQQFRAPGSWPTPQTRCFVCDPVAAGGGWRAARQQPATTQPLCATPPPYTPFCPPPLTSYHFCPTLAWLCHHMG